MDILDQMEAWRKNARFISEQDFFSRMMFEIIKNRKEIERLRDSLERIACFCQEQCKMNCAGWIASSALKEKE